MALTLPPYAGLRSNHRAFPRGMRASNPRSRGVRKALRHVGVVLLHAAPLGGEAEREVGDSATGEELGIAILGLL